MEWLQEYGLRLLLILGYLAVIAYHAWSSRDSGEDIEDYIRPRLGGWTIALSFYATFMSTNTFIGHAGKSWDVGLIWYIKGVVIVMAAYLSWHAVAPRFFALANTYKSLTLPDFLGHRYGSSALRRITAVIVFGASALYLTAVYKGSSMALQAYLGLDYKLAAFLIFLVVTAYTLTGGLKSVIKTDVIQGVFMLVGGVLIIGGVLYQGGGLTALVENLREQDPDLVSWEGKMPFLAIAGLSIAGAVKMLVDPRQISRFYALKDNSALKTAGIISPILILITYACMLPVGAFAHALIPAGVIEDSDAVVPYLLNTANILGSVLGSVFLLVLLSAAMSSLDSSLLVAASSIGRDVVIIPDNDKRAVIWTRIGVVGVSLVSMLVALNPFGDIVTITAFSGSLYAACFLPSLVVGLYWKGGTAKGALASVLLGAAITIAWHFAKRADWTDLHEVYVGTVAGMAVYVGVSLLTRKDARNE
jgi:SSS family transporter